jgi:hypothetical protein
VGEGPTATLLRQLIEVDLLARPTCHGPMRVVAFITRASVVDQFLTHLRTRAARDSGASLTFAMQNPPPDARRARGTRWAAEPPSTRTRARPGTSRASRPPADASSPP